MKGFTIIELMIVMAIIGILAAVIVPAWTEFNVEQSEKVRQVQKTLRDGLDSANKQICDFNWIGVK